ncbi:MAG: exo-alpha-sialidase, partial [Bacteroidales bacterium]|nr:exo-alpha-sialidase [Bacteroidales bacterium]
MFEDGTVGATWTMGFADPGFADRGTGYNYYDGNNWGVMPTERIESIRTGWPSYAPYGENGELVISHDFAAGSLYFLARESKGTGTWSETELAGPGGSEISWTRSTTSGINNSIIQSLYITWPVANGGTVYEGLDGALLYSRSSDGGATWDIEHQIIDGLGSDDYVGFSADEYDWAASQGDNIAFLVGSSWIDFVLMKSTDGGDTWEKTVIWENPYPFFDPAAPFATDTFYCVDGDHHLAFDSQGKVHVVFGINRAHSDGSTTFW